MLLRIILSLILLGILSPSVADTVYKFRQTQRDNGAVYVSTWTAKKSEGALHFSSDTIFDFIEIKIKDNDAYFWHVKRKATDMEITVNKTEKGITVQGLLDGKPVSKHIESNISPWFPAPGLMLKSFILSKETKKKFYVFSTQDANFMKMVVKKTGSETLLIDTISYDAIHVEMTPPGLKSLFWKADFWFDARTGDMLKYAGLVGPPGSPFLTMEKLIAQPDTSQAVSE